ncbi:MAG: BrnT family toxin [Candidatus Riflebacteria bacterium]|nr:BrnT family toxin [Candidatus Riflebacteria bacterium]
MHSVPFSTTSIKVCYGEDRFATLGFIEDILVRLSYTMRGEVLRVISLRKATVAEKRLYEEESLF